MNFKITEKDCEKLDIWRDEQDSKVREKNSNYGAMGGGYTFMFTPTNLGMIIKVKNVLTGDTVDLTDWDDF